MVAVWHSSNGVYCVNEVALHRAWVTIFGQATTSVFNQPPRPTQLPTLSGVETNTGQSIVMLCSCGVKADTVHSICGCMCGWQVKLCDPSLTCAMLECLGGQWFSIRCIVCILLIGWSPNTEKKDLTADFYFSPDLQTKPSHILSIQARRQSLGITCQIMASGVIKPD